MACGQLRVAAPIVSKRIDRSTPASALLPTRTPVPGSCAPRTTSGGGAPTIVEAPSPSTSWSTPSPSGLNCRTSERAGRPGGKAAEGLCEGLKLRRHRVHAATHGAHECRQHGTLPPVTPGVFAHKQELPAPRQTAAVLASTALPCPNLRAG